MRRHLHCVSYGDSTTLPTPILPTPVLPTKDPDVSFRLLVRAILTAMKELIQRIYAPIGVNRLWSRGSAVGLANEKYIQIAVV